MSGINAADFTAEELTSIIGTLRDFRDEAEHLKKKVDEYFTEFDKDTNGYLDRRELRHFLITFFTTFKIHLPVTDEYVDAVFREIDLNKDNKIQAEELEAYAMHFVNQLLPAYETALAQKGEQGGI